MSQKLAILAFLLSFSLIICVMAWNGFSSRKYGVECEVLTPQETPLALYVDKGSGFNGQNVATSYAYAAPIWQLVRFNLPSSRFLRQLRFDFNPPAEKIGVRRCALLDEQGFPLKEMPALIPKPHSQTLLTNENGQEVFIAQGTDPQLLLSFSRLKFLLAVLNAKVWLSYTLLLYPLCALFLWGGRRGKGERVVAKKNTLHFLFIGASCLFWAFFLIILWAENGRHQTVIAPNPTETILLPEGPSTAQEIQLQRPDLLRISAYLYEPQQRGKVKGSILLLHGNYPQGQSYPFYTLLAAALSEQNYRVMTIDFAGFGRSDDPFASALFSRYDLESETEVALSYLSKMNKENGNINVIGHSMGADPALHVGLRHPDVANIILLGPPRRVWERFHNPSDLAFFWNWALQTRQEIYGKAGFPPRYSQLHWQQDILKRDMVRLLPSLQSQSHKPVLFVDGGREPIPDQVFLREYVQRVSWPCLAVTVSGVDHTTNVEEFTTPAHYEPETMAQTAQLLANWCNEDHNASRTKAFNLFLNLVTPLFLFE